MGGAKRVQFRWEVYNLFNTVNWSGIDTSAQFNPAGEQVDAAVRQGDDARATRASCRCRCASASEGA